MEKGDGREGSLTGDGGSEEEKEGVVGSQEVKKTKGAW